MQVKMLYSRVQSIFRGRSRKEKQMEIVSQCLNQSTISSFTNMPQSAPYDLKKSEKIVLPGISQDEYVTIPPSQLIEQHH